MIKIQGGTAPSKNLCLSCTYFNKVEFQNGNTDMFCSSYELRGDRGFKLHAMVAECTAFEDKGYITLYELEKMAWVLEVSKQNKIGFITPKDWKEKHGAKEKVED